jgi:anti-repressor protein
LLFGQVRTTLINDEPWFVGRDVATALGYAKPENAISKHVDEEDKKIQKPQNGVFENIPNRGVTIINESGMYSLILSSKLPTAKKFKRWVTAEVLPSIRKPNQPALFI